MAKGKRSIGIGCLGTIIIIVLLGVFLQARDRSTAPRRESRPAAAEKATTLGCDWVKPRAVDLALLLQDSSESSAKLLANEGKFTDLGAVLMRALDDGRIAPQFKAHVENLMTACARYSAAIMAAKAGEAGIADDLMEEAGSFADRASSAIGQMCQ